VQLVPKTQCNWSVPPRKSVESDVSGLGIEQIKFHWLSRLQIPSSRLLCVTFGKRLEEKKVRAQKSTHNSQHKMRFPVVSFDSASANWLNFCGKAFGFLFFFILVAADLLVGKYQRIVSEPNLTTGNMQLATLQHCNLQLATLQHCHIAIVTRSA